MRKFIFISGGARSGKSHYAVKLAKTLSCKVAYIATCTHPDKARPSMEAMGIDVYATVNNAGYELKVVTSEQETATYHGLLLLK